MTGDGVDAEVACRTTGLSTADADARWRRDGPNLLPVSAPPAAWRQLLQQLVSFFALMLWVAGGLALVGGLPQLAIAIFVVVVINAGFAFAQEHRAERAAARLRGLLPQWVTVVRDGHEQQIAAERVVVDDLVVLGIGDRVCADLHVEASSGLLLDTSTLTGETVPLAVDDGETAYAGTFVTQGEARATVVATGDATRLAEIATLTRTTDRAETPLAAHLRGVVRTISLVAISVGAGFFGVMLLLGTPAGAGFIFAVGVTVALVPEGLLPTVTFSLAMAAQRMADRHALVRHLEAVETLGSTTFICTDKTGTLTRNEMSVVAVWTPIGAARVTGLGYAPEGRIETEDERIRDAVTALALAAARCTSGRAVQRDGRWLAQGDPMEAALHALAHRAGLDPDADAEQRPERARFSFDQRRRQMSVVVGDHLLVKGAPDAVLSRCNEVAAAHHALEDLAREGLRVLAVATRRVELGETPVVDELERDLDLLGLVGIHDPPREGVGKAIAACRRAGIRVGMVTGDQPATAAAIARQIGLLTASGTVLTRDDLPDDGELLAASVDRDGVVVSRVTPEDKLRIAQALQRRGHVVAMTGDGVNDGPALEAADIGVAMGASGTDVARDAADLVLLDDDFSTIVRAVEQGRGTFSNIRRFLTYHLTDNVAELSPFLLWALSGGRFPLALGVLQILALDIGTDTFTAVALGAEQPSRHVLDRPPTRGRLLDRTVAARAFGVLGPTEATFAIAAFVVAFLAQGWLPGQPFPSGESLAAASGAAFLAIIFGQAANAFACRSATRSPRELGWTSNRLLVVAVAIAVLLGGLFVVVPPIAGLLGHSPPPVAGLGVAMATAPAVLAADHLAKRTRRRRAPR